MFLMYVDESGDVGLDRSPTRYFILTGVVVHESRWRAYLERLIDFRKHLRDTYGLRMREEFHAAHMLRNPGDLMRIPRHDRLAMMREFADQMAAMSDLNLVNIVVDKQLKLAGYDVFEKAWQALIQRFENTLVSGNFRGSQSSDEQGMIIADHTDQKKLQTLTRRMRRHNPVPYQQAYGTGYRNLRLTRMIEDPVFRDSADSYFIQMADLAAYLLYQREEPNSYMRKKGGKNYFDRLKPILCTVASARDPDGIVRL